MTERRSVRLAGSVRERLFAIPDWLKTLAIRQRETREEAFKGIGVFEDFPTRIVYGYVQRELAISDWLIYVKATLNKSVEQDLTLDDVKDRLSALVENGFVLRHDPDNPGSLPSFTPTAKGVRVFKTLSQI